jgi:hypothetical protein
LYIYIDKQQEQDKRTCQNREKYFVLQQSKNVKSVNVDRTRKKRTLKNKLSYFSINMSD